MKKFGLLVELGVMTGGLLHLACGEAGAATYHVDAVQGSDAGTGLSPTEAWASLGRVNATTFQPGDAILFRAGDVFVGQLWPKGAGAAGLPIRVGRYGDGAPPRIDGEGAVDAVVRLHNQSHWEISDLELVNLKPTRGANCGVLITGGSHGTLRGIRLSGLEIRHINGLPDYSIRSAGILIDSGGGTPTTVFDGLVIEDCVIEDSGAVGILVRTTEEAYYRNEPRRYHTGVVVRRNVLRRIWRDGILLIGCQGALIEKNRLDGGNMSNLRGSAGIWVWSSDDSVIQLNEVSGMRGLLDGQAFDSDFNTRNTVIQYNYSHGNQGGAFAVFAKGASTNPHNVNTIIRYNVSRNDGHNDVPGAPYDLRHGELFYIAGPASNTVIHNNTFHVPADKRIIMSVNDWGGLPTGLKFFNNLFLVEDGGAIRNWVPPNLVGMVWSRNAFFAVGDASDTFPGGLPVDPDAVFENPRLIDRGTGAEAVATLDGYRLHFGSPLRAPAGAPVPVAPERDFWGEVIPAGVALGIGAHHLGDDNNNGWPDDFEALYPALFAGGTPALGGDFDQDGWSDEIEMKLGTNPEDAGDFLSASTRHAESGELFIEFPTAPGVLYEVLGSDRLDGGWLPRAHVTGTGQPASVPVEIIDEDASAFFRVQAFP